VVKALVQAGADINEEDEALGEKLRHGNVVKVWVEP
jgi:hypothetical protein